MKDYKRNRIKNQRLKRNNIKRQTKKLSFMKNKYAIYIALSMSAVFVLFFLILKFIPGMKFELDLLKVKNIRVMGNKYISESEARKLSGIEGTNFLKTSLQEAAQRIIKDPWVKGVDLRRRFPNIISISIDERSPFSYVQLTSLNLIDENGIILKRADSIKKKELPIITGLNETTHLQLGDAIPFTNLKTGIETLKEIRDRNLIPISEIITLDVKDVTNPVLTLKNSSGKIYIGTGDLEEKFKKLRAYYGDSKGISHLISPVAYIDLRFKDRIIIMPLSHTGQNKGNSL